MQYQKKEVKSEVKWKMIAGIDREELILLKFTEKEKDSLLNWKHSKEFEYQDNMFDVVETETVGDTTYYWVWWDHKETELNKQLDELIVQVLGNNPQKQEKQDQLIEFYKKLYCDNFENTISLSKMLDKGFPGCITFTTTGFRSIAIPPPRQS